MSKKYTKDSFSESLDRRLSGFQADPWLAQRVMASEEGEVKPVKKMSFAAVLAIVLVCVLATGALAAAMNIFGLGDFLFRQAEKNGATLTEEFMESVRQEDISAGTENVKYTVQESYYDGEFLRVIMNIRPGDNVLLLNDNDFTTDKYTRSVYSQTEPENMTAGEYAGKDHNGRTARIRAEAVLWPDAAKKTEIPYAMSEFRLNEDGSVTAYYQWEVWNYIKQEDRDILLKMSYTPGTVSGETNQADPEERNTEITEIPLKIHFTGSEKYYCNEKLAFPEAGVKVHLIAMTVTPLDINCNVYWKITDADRRQAAQADNTCLGFQLVTPDSTEPDGWKAIPAGFAGYTYTTQVDTDEYRTTFTVSRDAFSDHYALRAVNTTLKQTFGTVEFDVKPREEESSSKSDSDADAFTADWLYDFKAEKPEKMTAENTSFVKNGIRLELVSSSVKNGMVNMVFSLEDTEGNRISENTEADIIMDGEGVETRYDAEQKKLFLTWTTEYEETEDPAYELEIALLRNSYDIEVDLLPLLKEYGSQAKLIPIREEDLGSDDHSTGKEEVLDYTNSLEIPLSKHVMLSGIGIVDDVLHVQFHYPKHHYEVVRLYKDADSRVNEWAEGPYCVYSYGPYECWAYLYEAEERHEELPLSEDIEGPLGTVWGGTEGNETPEEEQIIGGNLNLAEWHEFRFKIASGLTETQKLTAGIHEEEPPIIGLWTINVSTGLVSAP